MGLWKSGAESLIRHPVAVGVIVMNRIGASICLRITLVVVAVVNVIA